MRTSVVTPYAGYLRVYEPLSAFPAADQRRWAEYAGSGEPLDPVTGMAAERQRALSGLLATPPIVVPTRESREAFVLQVDGTAMVCPLNTRLRSWLALEELLSSLPDALVEAVAPPVVVEQATADFARWRRANPGRSAHIMTNPWFVPLRWFIPFIQDERVVRVDEPRALYFRTPMVEARRRVARALRVLSKAIEDGPIVAGVTDLGRWLEEFHPHAWIELDYGGLVHLIDDARLAADSSAADVAEALGALAADDAEAAAAAYTRLIERWRVVQAFGHAS